MIGVGWYLRNQNYTAAYRANLWGLGLSSVYMLWTLAAQWHVSQIARQSLEAQQLSYQKILVTPAPLNTVLWRIVVITNHGYAEGFYSLLDNETAIALHHVATDNRVPAHYHQLKAVQQLAAFSRGFYSLRQDNEALILTDLRMGQEGSYAFEFVIDSQNGVPLAQRPMRNNSAMALPWLWHRTLGQPLSSPYWLNDQ